MSTQAPTEVRPPEVGKVVEYWNRQADAFDSIYSGAKPGWKRALDKWLRKDMYQRLEWVLEHSGDVTGKSVCDLGCGTGRFMIQYAKRGARRMVGLDSAPTMIARAKELMAQAGVADRCELRVENILECRTDEVFDVTIAVGVFDYVSDGVPFLSRIRKITRGRFLGTFPRLWTYRMPIRKVRLGVLGCPVFFFTPSQIRELLDKCGFKCERIDKFGAIYGVLGVPK
jgi:SAM-dependent methyltransferase